MGLMTMLTGKNRLQRQMEKLESTKGEQYHKLVLRHHKDLGLESPEEALAAVSLLCVCDGINMFLTHHLRTQLTIHPKWTSQGNFDDEGPALVAWIRPHLMILNDNNLSFDKRLPLFGIAMGGSMNKPEFNDLIQDMFKTADFKRMGERYPQETKRGINVMVAMYRSLCIQSSIDGNPDQLLRFFQELRIIFFMDWKVNESGVFV